MLSTQALLFRRQFLKQAPMALTAANQRGFKQVHNLNEIVYTTQWELHQRAAKYLERTDKVYKPSQTLEFNREGEILLYSCDNIKNSTVYFKYPYCFYDCAIPLSWYVFFVNPFFWKWQVTLSIFYLSNMFAWIPHALYWKSLDRKLHEFYLLRGGKYVRIRTQNPLGDIFYSWANICEFHLLTEDKEDFAQSIEEESFLNKDGQLKYEVHVQLDNYVEHAVLQQDEIIQFMKEGTVHQPELFEQVCKGYNIDTSDFVVNTEHNVRYNEPNHNV